MILYCDQSKFFFHTQLEFGLEMEFCFIEDDPLFDIDMDSKTIPWCSDLWRTFTDWQSFHQYHRIYDSFITCSRFVWVSDWDKDSLW